MACNIESFAEPAWWAGATTVVIDLVDGSGGMARDRVDLEMLPQGIADNNVCVFFPWSNISSMAKDS